MDVDTIMGHKPELHEAFPTLEPLVGSDGVERHPALRGTLR